MFVSVIANVHFYVWDKSLGFFLVLKFRQSPTYLLFAVQGGYFVHVKASKIAVGVHLNAYS